MKKQEQTSRSFNLDNSAIMHMATIRKNHSNSFRFVLILKEIVDPEILQEAINRITPRFPTIIAGVKSGLFRHKVVPCEEAPRARFEDECLAPMTRAEVKKCAIRFFYKEKRISVECFHSMTDGHGCIVLLNTLMSEYFRLKHDIHVQTTEMVLSCDEDSMEAEERDDFYTFAGETSAPVKHHNVHQIPGTRTENNRIFTITKDFETKKILDAAHRHNVSVTTFLCGIMMKAVSEAYQRRTGDKPRKPIQIMVPINLRKLFPSKTLRNFSLYALPNVKDEDFRKPFGEMLQNIKSQMNKQSSKDYIAATMATHTKAEKSYFFKMIPLFVKCAVLRFVNDHFGECNSCISLSNLGNVSFPEEFNRYMEGINVILTPRRKSPYNCGVISFCGMMSITFSRICMETDLAEIFFELLQYYM